jgi:hypothetical protein
MASILIISFFVFVEYVRSQIGCDAGSFALKIRVCVGMLVQNTKTIVKIFEHDGQQFEYDGKQFQHDG